MIRFILPLISIVFVANCGRGRRTSDCNKNSDCPPGQQCVAERCQVPLELACDSARDCDAGQSCVGGSCQRGGEIGTFCGDGSDCNQGLLCELLTQSCVECLNDDHCPLGVYCGAGRCGGGTSGGDSDPGVGGDPGAGGDSRHGDSGGSTCDGSEDAADCFNGIDDDCDGRIDLYDLDCPSLECGEPANAQTTTTCNPEYPSNFGSRVCEADPNAPSSSDPARCAKVCRTGTECAPNYACYPTRRSLNMHFCAPVRQGATGAAGGTCSTDDNCRSGICASGTCREVCTRDADCLVGEACRLIEHTPAYVGSAVATGICIPRDAGWLGAGSPCTDGESCASAACTQRDNDEPLHCSALCGTDSDCATGEVCGVAFYSRDPIAGYGLRTCVTAPENATVAHGDVCADRGDCATGFCDNTYYPSPSDALIEPFCNTVCDRDTDCPPLVIDKGGMRMRCIVGTAAFVQPLVTGFCAPSWCETSSDCNSGDTCTEVNPARWKGLPKGMCQ